MGNISGQDELVTKKDLADFYKFLLPYLGGGNGSSSDPVDSSITTVSGYTPLGTIISYYGETAPRFYLACDGSEYNKSDYPELANHLLSLTNHSQYEVSGDNTKFKVPDLRGEFLRGTGTNGYENQGNGANVGVHQNGTTIPTYLLHTDGKLYLKRENNTKNNFVLEADAVKTGAANVVYSSEFNYNRIYADNAETPYSYATRPTNTSVLYCIAYKDIYTSPMNDYSTDEQIVGTWIDGKPIYQKTINFGALPNATQKMVAHEINNLDYVISLDGIAENTVSKSRLTLPFIGFTNLNEGISLNIPGSSSDKIIIRTGQDRTAWDKTYITIKYTKTTD